MTTRTSPASVAASTNPNDAIRRQILRYFYDRNVRATSKRGKKGAAAKIMDVRRELKAEYGHTQQQVISNLNYLIDKGWVREEVIEKTVRVNGGTVPSTVTWYSISAAGIDHIEGESEFTVAPRFAGININATGHNVITMGDGNVVNVKYSELHRELERLRREVSDADEVDDGAKLEVAANIDTIQAQLVRQTPDRGIVTRAWKAVEGAVTAAGFFDLVQRVLPLIQPLLP